MVKKRSAMKGMTLKTKASSVLPVGYRPELDSLPLLGDIDASFYMQCIGILWWTNLEELTFASKCL